MPREYALHLNAIAAAEHAAAEARKTVAAHRHRLSEAARQDARESCEAVGIVLGRTILTIKHRRRQEGNDYRDWPIIPIRITCWSTPEQLGHGWHFQMHHARARRDGQRDQRITEDWHNIAVAHPSALGAELLARYPLWQNDPTYTARVRIVPSALAPEAARHA